MRISGSKMANKAIKFAPYGRRTLVPRAVYCGRYVFGATLIKQPTSESGCGIACISNIFGHSYDVAYNQMANAGCKNKHDDRVTVQQIEKYLSKGSYVFFSREDKLECDMTALLYVRWPHDKRYKHWILYADGKFWDPDPEIEGPTRCYATEPEVIISLFGDLKMKRPLDLRSNLGKT